MWHHWLQYIHAAGIAQATYWLRYGLDVQTVVVQLWGSRPAEDPPSLPFNLYRGLSSGANRPGREADLSPILTPGLRMNGLISPPPTPIPSGRLQGQICLSSLSICHGAELVLESWELLSRSNYSPEVHRHDHNSLSHTNQVHTHSLHIH